jgi:hypothetical protein
MIEATISGTLQGRAIERGNGHVTARIFAATRGGLPVAVNVTAYGATGERLLSFATGDGLEVSGTIEPRVRMDRNDNPLFVFDVTAWAVKRLGDSPENDRRPGRPRRPVPNEASDEADGTIRRVL